MTTIPGSNRYDETVAAPVKSIDVELLNHPVSYLPAEMFPDAGGECIFLGRTRVEEHPTHGRLVRLKYETYGSMAVAVLQQLAAHAISQFGCKFVRIHHAVGEVPPGEASVLVQTICGHRGAAFDSCRYLIDHLKSEAPIWKREEWADGATWAAGVPVKQGAKS